MTVWMATCPREGVSKKRWFTFFEDYDIHHWVLGRETGRNGYKHWQVRFESGQFDTDEGFELLCGKKGWFKGAHFEKASDTWEYEKEDGEYFTSEDRPETIAQRFGRFKCNQQEIYNLTMEGGDRTITVWYDEHGSAGKSWFCGALWERRIAHIVQPTNTAKGLVQDCASEVIQHGYRPIIVIDIPRTWKWTDDMYVAIEMVKDGLIKDPRYGSKTINIRGVKVLVLTNSMPNVGKLSRDRWAIYDDALFPDGFPAKKRRPLS